MSPNRFASVKALLLEVADLTESQRRAYLDEACRDDPDLRREVERILSHGDDRTGILKTGGIAPKRSPSIPSTSTDLPDEIAGYRIVRLLGEGGMGVVYEAEQQSPRRPVALKVIRGAAYVDDQHVRRFKREAQALGRLKHPGIAAIYESGRTEDGQHFFAMELVGGVPLDEYLTKHPVKDGRSKGKIRQRLYLFLQICDAISYAHQRGVIHRDLKPGNILVMANASGSQRGSGTDYSQVKILDFGLARMTDADVAVTTMVSEVGKIQGTLAYMSPEQARGNPDEIDIRSDVYALGVLLYEMLTGALPYDVRHTLIHQAVRIICEESPRRPSTFTRQLRGDLETICLSALEKEPDRRYTSVAALIEDIERYLSDQPILARPPSASYQLRKLVARHRGAFVFVATLVTLLAAFAVTMSVMFGLQRQARLRAVIEAQRAEARRLVSLGRLELDRSPTAALAYSITSLERMDLPEARQLAMEALWQGPVYSVPPDSWKHPTVTNLDFSPDGRWLGVGDQASGEIHLYPEDGSHPSRLQDEVGEVDFVRFDPASGLLASSCFTEDGVMTTSVWSVTTGVRTFSRTFPVEIRPLLITGGGNQLITVRATESAFVSWWRHEDVVIESWPLDGGDHRRLVSLGPDGMRCTPVIDSVGRWMAHAVGNQIYVVRFEDLVGAVSRNGKGRLVSADRDDFRSGPGGEAKPDGIGRNGPRLDDLGIERRILGRHGDEVAGWALVLDPSGRRLASFDQSREVRVWSVESGRLERTFTGSKRPIRMRFDPLGRRLATGHVDGTVALWDIDGPPAAAPLALMGLETSVLGLAFHPHRAWLATTGQVKGGNVGRSVVLWPIIRRHPYVLRGHEDPVRGLAFSSNGEWMVSSARDGTVRLWSLGRDADMTVGCETTAVSTSAPLAPAASTAGGCVLNERWGSVNVVAVDPLHRFVVTGSSRPPSVELIPLRHGPVGDGPKELGGFHDPVWAVAVSPDGHLVAAGGGQMMRAEAVVHLWNVTSGEEQVLDPGDGTMINDVASQDDHRILAGGTGGIRRWSIDGGTNEIVCVAPISRFAIASDRQRLVVVGPRGDASGVVWTQDFVTGSCRNLPAHGDEVVDVAISTDGTLIVSGDRTGVVRVGRFDGGDTHRLLGHEGAVRVVAVSPDGRYVGSAGDDGIVRLWPVPSGEPIHNLSHDAFLDRIRKLTNLRARPDSAAAGGYRLAADRFRGWQDVPIW